MEQFKRLTEGGVLLAYINDHNNIMICMADTDVEVRNLIIHKGARVIPFNMIIKVYEKYSQSHERGLVSFEDWIIGEVK